MNQTIDILRKAIRHLDEAHTPEQYARVRRDLENLASHMEWGEKNDLDFKAIVDSSNDGIYVVDKDSVIRYINPAYSKYTQLEPEQVIGKTSTELVDEGVFRRVATPEVLESKRPHVLLGYIRTVDGRDIYGYCIVNPVFDGDGNIRYAVVTLYDPERLKGRYYEFAESNNSVEPPITVREGISEGFGEPVIGTSIELKQTYAIAQRVAGTDATVLICGESGVGKEGVANFICANSPRRDKPFVKVNCTAIPANLLESELFGYEKGAFTGANTKGKKGLFELANGGTILLDEIGDLSIDLQAKLLRVLQQKEIMRIGGTQSIKLDVRIIASTNTDLKRKILEGQFREDLYYRLSTIPISVAPLRERPGDIPQLIEYYLNYFIKHHHRTIHLSDEHMMVLQRYNWPGNIRQLKNIVEYLVVCGDEYLTNIDPLLKILGVDNYNVENSILPSLEESMNSYEKSLIIQTLNKVGGVRKAAKVLGIDPGTLSRKIKKHKIELPSKNDQ